MFAFSLNPIDWVTGAAGAIVESASNAVFDQFTEWVEEGLAFIAEETAAFLADIGNANLGDETLLQLGGMFKWVALVSVVVTMILAAARAATGAGQSMAEVLREIPITLMMLAGWYFVVSLWLEGTNAITRVLLTDTLIEGFSNGLMLDPGIASFFRAFIALFLLIFLVIFLLEMLVLSHMLTFGALIGPVAIGLRPWPGLRDVSARMARNLAALSLTPPLAVASMAIALRTANEDGQMSLTASLGALAGLVVSVLSPALVARFLPLDGQGNLGVRGMVAAGVGSAAVVGGVVATGGAAAAAGSAAPGALNATSLGAGAASAAGGGDD